MRELLRTMRSQLKTNEVGETKLHGLLYKIVGKYFIFFVTLKSVILG